MNRTRHKMRGLLCVLLLAACAADPEPVPPSASVVVPAELQVCPDGGTPPPTPPPPRSIPQVMEWAIGLYGALIRTEHAREVCARRLSRLNRWIETEGLLNGH